MSYREAIERRVVVNEIEDAFIELESLILYDRQFCKLDDADRRLLVKLVRKRKRAEMDRAKRCARISR